MNFKNIYEALESSCIKNNDKIFFVRENITYGEMLTRIKKRALTLTKKLKLKAGDCVGLMCDNIPEFHITYFAAVSQKLKVLMLDSSLTEIEHKNMAKFTDCKVIMTQEAKFFEGGPEMFNIEIIDETNEADFIPADAKFDDIANLSFTSGSTGNPKVVGLTHRNVLAVVEGTQFYRPVIKEGYIFYGFLPLYHIYGFVINIIAPIMLDCQLLLQTQMNPNVMMEDFKQYKPHVIPAVPRVWEIFQKKIITAFKEKRVYNLMSFITFTRRFWDYIGMGWLIKKFIKPVKDNMGGRVKVLISAGATLKPNTRKFYEKLDFSVGDCYGLTETTGPSNFNFAFKQEDGKMFYAGPLQGGNEIEIREKNKKGIGDIWVRGNVVMPGYINNDEANKESFDNNGWFKTGDVGLFDKKGRLIVKARKKNVIVLDSGKNVYPDELEDLYLQHDDILNCAIFERTIRDKIVAYGVFQVKEGVTLKQLNLMIASSNIHIAPYKWVLHYAMTKKELPQTSTKKIKHHEVANNLYLGMYSDRKE